MKKIAVVALSDREFKEYFHDFRELIYLEGDILEVEKNRAAFVYNGDIYFFLRDIDQLRGLGKVNFKYYGNFRERKDFEQIVTYERYIKMAFL